MKNDVKDDRAYSHPWFQRPSSSPQGIAVSEKNGSGLEKSRVPLPGVSFFSPACDRIERIPSYRLLGREHPDLFSRPAQLVQLGPNILVACPYYSGVSVILPKNTSLPCTKHAIGPDH